MKKIIVILGVSTVLGFVVHGWGWCEWDMTRQVQENIRNTIIDADLQDIARATRERTPVNEEDDGCQWAKVVKKDGSPMWKKTADGYHRIYLKVCDNDPK